MRKIFSFFCVLSALLCSISGYSNDSLPEIIHSWGEADQYLYLDVELQNGMKFDDGYTTFTLKNNPGLGADILCFPLDGVAIFSSNGAQFKETTFTVSVVYDRGSHSIDYRIEKKFLYEDKGWFSSNTAETYFYHDGQLNEIDLDLSEAPEFYIISSNKGYFTFKKGKPRSLEL